MRSHTLIITANAAWETWYPAKFTACPEVMVSLKRRFSQIREYRHATPDPLDAGAVTTLEIGCVNRHDIIVWV